MQNDPELKEVKLRLLKSWEEEPDAKFLGRLTRVGRRLCVDKIESSTHPGKGIIKFDKKWGLTQSRGNIPVLASQEEKSFYQKNSGRWVSFDFQIKKDQEGDLKIYAEVERVLGEDELSKIFAQKGILKSLEEKEVELQKNISTANDTLTNIEAELNQIRDLRETINREVLVLENKKEKLSEKKKDLERRIGLLQKFGLLRDVEHITTKKVTHRNDERPDKSLKDSLQDIYGFLAQKSGVFSEDFVRIFTALMCTHDIVILAGRSGTGKTSFCRLFAEAINAEISVIPVKPNWLSSEDLLGYFNPTTGKYYATPFMKAIEKANTDPTKLHLVVLDEMNIARPEYYFADLLSCLEDRTTSEVSIDLPTTELRPWENIDLDGLSRLLSVYYDTSGNEEPKEILNNRSARQKLSSFLGCDDKDVEDYLFGLSLNKQFGNVIPAKVNIPSNIRFIGTINIDETTHFFSPKVLDRVHILKLDDPLAISKERQCRGPGVKVCVNPKSFGSRKNYPAYNSDNSIAKLLFSIMKESRKIGADVSLRVIRQCMLFEAKAIKLGLNHKDIAGYVIRSKIFPRLVFDAADAYGQIRQTKRKALEDIKSKIIDQVSGECLDELDKLIRQVESEDHQVNYWSL